MFIKTDLNLLDLICLVVVIFFIFIGFAGITHIFSGSAINPLLDVILVLICFGISGITYYGRKWQVTKYSREEAHRRETALDYPTAIDLWEKLGEIEEAGRVRKLQSDLNSPKMEQTIVHGQTVVQGDQITKTEIKDSVINKSNIGSDKD